MGAHDCEGKRYRAGDRRLPLDGTAKDQRGLGWMPSSSSRHWRGVQEGQAHGFGPRTGAAVLAIHSHIRVTLGGPVSVPAGSFSGSGNAIPLAVNQSLSGTGRQKKTGTSRTIGLPGSAPPDLMKSHNPQGVAGAGGGTSGFSCWQH